MTKQSQVIFEFIKSQSVGVVATINETGLPEAATMAVSQTDKLELIFQTPNTTRKYANLQHNSHVAVVFGWDTENMVTVQYEGKAREVTDDAERVRLAAIHVAKNPMSKPYASLPNNKFFLVTPTEIRYSDILHGVYFEVRGKDML